MTAPRDPAARQPAGAREVLEQLAVGDPDERLPLAELLDSLRQSAFGLALFIAVLPAFLPVPGVAGGLSGPLVVLGGLQLLIGLEHPWLPGFITRRGPQRGRIRRFSQMIDASLQRLEKLVRPRLPIVLESRLCKAITGLLLVLLGVLLALPIPFTNYVFGILLMLFVLALLERDGALMLLAWLLGGIAIVTFGTAMDRLLVMGMALLQRWF